MTPAMSIDLLLGALALFLGWRAVSARQQFVSIMAFIALGLTLALIWLQLAAPALALAEAALGAGITGSLLLLTLQRLETRASAPPAPVSKVIQVSAGLLCLVLFLVLAHAILQLPDASPGLTREVMQQLEHSGVDSPITAVLLNYRSYDTLLEILILTTAIIALWAHARLPLVRRITSASVLLEGSYSLLLPLFILIAGYLLWLGSFGAGGAFQAGVVLAASGIFALLVKEQLIPASLWPRLLLISGPLIFLLVGAAGMAQFGNLLQYPVAWAGTLILLIEFMVMVSIALTLTLMVQYLFGEQPHDH